MTDNDAFEKGYDAYWDAVDAEENPHEEGTQSFRSWEDGWLKAQKNDCHGTDG